MIKSNNSTTTNGAGQRSASLLIKSGESAKVVADRLGHSDPAFTLKTYVDTDESQQKTASEKLARILSR